MVLRFVGNVTVCGGGLWVSFFAGGTAEWCFSGLWGIFWSVGEVCGEFSGLNGNFSVGRFAESNSQVCGRYFSVCG